MPGNRNKTYRHDGIEFRKKGHIKKYKELKKMKKKREIFDFEVYQPVTLKDEFACEFTKFGKKRKKCQKTTITPTFTVYHHGFTEYLDLKNKYSGHSAYAVKFKWLMSMYANKPEYKFTIEYCA